MLVSYIFSFVYLRVTKGDKMLVSKCHEKTVVLTWCGKELWVIRKTNSLVNVVNVITTQYLIKEISNEKFYNYIFSFCNMGNGRNEHHTR